MTKTFTSFANRLDASLVGFSSDDNGALKAAICTNAATAYVTQKKAGGPISVPTHAAAATKAHLLALGWEAK